MNLELGICEKPGFTVVNEDFEQITDEPRELKTTVADEVYCYNTKGYLHIVVLTQHSRLICCQDKTPVSQT